MLVITNRKIKSISKEGVGGGDAFGEEINEKGPNELRLANVNRLTGGTGKTRKKDWEVRLVAEPERVTQQNLPSKKEFEAVLERCKKHNRNCLLFVHGYNKPFIETLEQGWRLQEKYDLEVVVFSWPSNPGGIAIKEYKEAKLTAAASIGAVNSCIDKIYEYMKTPFNAKALLECNISLSLMTYSLGNFLFQGYIEGSAYDGETIAFSNIVLCQADCDSTGHEGWVEKIKSGKRIYITINEDDKILGWSDRNFQKNRLGQTTKNLIARNAVYFDFTESPNIGNTHQIWGEDTNPAVYSFFKTVLNGGRAESIPDFLYDGRINAFRVARS